ncbi:hypothetical protein BIW11_10957 [Tropilaelaps mercedesae]|uniref:Uncharacterized protein n=1 Tax=Tropilaelaps mercedesae TaxID=418985 RepID=A0A1V9XDR2_9ACAR|nr:hypothetical protein BIW11_10957 [Tropilaelaps mercedesae]
MCVGRKRQLRSHAVNLSRAVCSYTVISPHLHSVLPPSVDLPATSGASNSPHARSSLDVSGYRTSEGPKLACEMAVRRSSDSALWDVAKSVLHVKIYGIRVVIDSTNICRSLNCRQYWIR